LEGYFHLFDINEDGELSPEEMTTMIQVLLENNPTMKELASNERAITKLVQEIFHEVNKMKPSSFCSVLFPFNQHSTLFVAQQADDDGNGVLSLREFLGHSQLITKKILLQNTSFSQRTGRLMKRMNGVGDESITRYSAPVQLL
jgi:hypothetical protein